MIKVIKPNRYETGYVHCRREEFLLDSVDDLALLPIDCVAGSVAYTADMSVWYKMGPSKEWVEVAEVKSGVTSWNDLSDKPFGEEEVENRVTLYDMTDISMSNGRGTIFDMDFGAIDIVTFNGIEYTGGVTHSIDTVVGADLYTVNGVEGFYFHISFAESVPYVMHPDIVAGEPYTLKCEKLEKRAIINSLPEKFIPENVAKKSELHPVATSGSWNDLTEKPFYTADVLNPLFEKDSASFLPGSTYAQREFQGAGGWNDYVYLRDGYKIRIVADLTLDGVSGSNGKCDTTFIYDYSNRDEYEVNLIDLYEADGKLSACKLKFTTGYDSEGWYQIRIYGTATAEGKICAYLCQSAVAKSLDEQFLPTSVPVIQSASAGQTVVVKAVDAEGKPTEWEAVEVPVAKAVPDITGDTPTAAEFNALLTALREAGLMAAE